MPGGSPYLELACLIHAQTTLKRREGGENNDPHRIQEAEGYFVKALHLSADTGIYTEYAQFRLRNLFDYPIEETIHVLQEAIRLKQMDKRVTYGSMQRLTLDLYLQNLVDKYKEISFKAYFLAHYLLIQAYLLNEQRSEASS